MACPRQIGDGSKSNTRQRLSQTLPVDRVKSVKGLHLKPLRRYNNISKHRVSCRKKDMNQKQQMFLLNRHFYQQ